MTRRTSITLVLALALVLLAAVTVAAGQGTPTAGEIPGSDNQSTARQGNESGTATQAGPCGPACRAQQETVTPVEPPTTITVTVTVTKTVYVLYCPLISNGPVSSTPDTPDILALPGDME